MTLAIVTCGAYSNSTDITVVINIGLTGNNADNAIGGQNTTTYKYGNAKVNVKGRVNRLGVLYGFE
jgi:hypothetical protein